MIALILRHRFVFQPDRLTAVIKPFAGYEHVFKFYAVVKQVMPDELPDLIKLTPADAVGKFVRVFSKKYFPLDIETKYNPDNAIQRLGNHIPVQWRGLDGYNYEPNGYRKFTRAQLLAETICRCPFETQSRESVVDEFVKVVRKEVGDGAAEGLVKLLPGNGCTLEEVEQALKESPYCGLLWWCRWIFHRTGNRFLDITRMDVAWETENIDALTADWPKFQDIDKAMDDFNSRLSGNFPAQAVKIIEYIDKHRVKTLAEVFADGNGNGGNAEEYNAL